MFLSSLLNSDDKEVGTGLSFANHTLLSDVARRVWLAKLRPFDIVIYGHIDRKVNDTITFDQSGYSKTHESKTL